MRTTKISLFLFLSFFCATSSAVSAQTEDWRQYSSAMAGFTVKYPADWRVETEEAKGQIWRVRVLSPGVRDDDVWEHNGVTICSKPRNASFEDLHYCADHHAPLEKHKIVSEKTFSLNGLEIRRLETKQEYSPNSIFFVAFISTKDRDFRIVGYFRKLFDLDRQVPVFDQMLGTLQLLKEKSVLTYRNEKYDFAITYPVSWRSCPIGDNRNPDEEELLILVPEGRNCASGNYLAVTRMTKYSDEKNNRDLKEFLAGKAFSKIVPYIEFGNIHAALGEKAEAGYIIRERYFYTNYPQTYELLKISEMYEANNEIYQTQAREILTTARRFLKAQ